MEKLKRPTLKQEVNIYRNLLVELHTTIWTGHHEATKKILDKIGSYSYSRTNSNGHEKEEEQNMIRTLLALGDNSDVYKK